MELAPHGCGHFQLEEIGEPGINTNSYIDDCLRSALPTSMQCRQMELNISFSIKFR